MLGWRLLVSAILIPAFAFLFYLDQRAGESAPVLLALALAIAVRSAWELAELFRVRSFEPSFWQTALLSCAVVASAWIGHLSPTAAAHGPIDAVGTPLFVFGLSVLWLLASNAARYREPGGRMETLGAEILIVCYVGLLLCLTAELRWVAGAQAGYLVLGSLLIAAKCGDIGGYTLGRLFGRRKMAPRLSPAKTWAGAAGALIGSALGGWIWLHWAPPYFDATWPPCPALWSVVYGLLIGVAGMVGDLCESLIKRDLGKKDAAALMPGFGGLLDLTDSVLYAGPIAYLLWTVLPLRTWQP
ncbi:MAG TPA: phosphatidate cytidylyltransferase [Planctomycetaceae bacterium]|jgi:phosphatidate cytidylyltransferase|nr:phosphatidate cytidylyltransferase [Planctomycetaceae bacterium]